MSGAEPARGRDSSPSGAMDSEAARAYHQATKHSPMSVRTSRHALDWPNQPLPFKVYKSLDPIPLPRDLTTSSMPALEAVSARSGSIDALTIGDLAKLAYYSAGITKTIQHPGRKMYFRAAACTGALYHIDLYLITGELQGLAPGVYHFSPHDFSLRMLRSGDYRGSLVDATFGEASISEAPAVAVLASTYWRNAWKYQDRAYRHVGWDSGTILANLLAVAGGAGLPAKVVLGFADEPVTRLLDLDSDKEGAVALVPLGAGAGPPAKPPETPRLHLATEPLSGREVDYPAVREMHAASILTSPEDAAAWRAATLNLIDPTPSGRLIPLDEDEDPVDRPIEEVIVRRGSSRRFQRDPITFRQLSTCLRRSTAGLAADYLYLLVHAVDGIPSGAYYYHRDRQALELLMEGDFRQQGGFLGLGQELPADASADVFLLTDLDQVLGRLGNRGYLAAQLEAGVLGGRLYLSAYAQGFGATGLTFFDDEVIDFFSPHAKGKDVMFLVALGRPARRAS